MENPNKKKSAGRGRGRGRRAHNQDPSFPPLPGSQQSSQVPFDNDFPSLLPVAQALPQQFELPEQPHRTSAPDQSHRTSAPEQPHRTSGPEQPYRTLAPDNLLVKLNGNRAKRPGYGTLYVKRVPLLVNYFPVSIPHGVVYQYDVDIQHAIVASGGQGKKSSGKGPTRIPVNVTKMIFQKLVESNQIFKAHLPVYDGNKILITRKPLPINKPETFKVSVIEDVEEKFFVVTVKPTKMKRGPDSEIRLDDFHEYIQKREGEFPAEAVKALDLVFKYGPSLKFFPAGRSIFFKPNPNEVPEFTGGRDIWFGFSQSVRPTEWGGIVNIDLAATTFYKEGPVISFAQDVLAKNAFNQPLEPYQLKNLGNEIKGLKVKVTHMQYERKFRVVGISKASARELKFPFTENGHTKEISVEKYFEFRYKKTLRYPFLPCLQMQPKEKKIYIPIEFCVLMPDQHCRKKLSDNQTALMIKRTLRTPKERFQDISTNLQAIQRASGPYLKEFDINIDPRPMEVESRVLNPPTIIYNETDKFTPRSGAWNMSDHQFFHGVNIDSWALLNYGFCRPQQLDNFIEMLVRIGQSVGLQLRPPIHKQDLQRENKLGVAEILKRVTETYKVKMIIIVLPNKGTDRITYAEVKQAADTKLGIITQCVKDINVNTKCNPQLISNICQKINAKMGGINNSIGGSKKEMPKLMNEPVIFMGADVTHPSPGDNTPSIAAVVGSLDRHPSKFAARIKVQRNRTEFQARVEIIIDLKDMVISLLKQFFKETHQKPGKIIFYRDGVSEGQFAEVCSYEINQIKLACQSLSVNYKPALTFVVVQKRHRTRFRPKFEKDGLGKSRNIEPGSVIDTKIISPVDFDFFLCSHYGIQGTSKPTHYTVLWDENNLSADEIQMLTYYLCHTYVRCTRAISIPAPVQYAHLAAFRARHHIASCRDFSSGSSSNGNGGFIIDDNPEISAAVEIQQFLKDSMYFA